jgi:alanine-glyoxylate transaminase/serine-glyoxylate transaminase/serine-pyruvate transaminase
VEFSLFERLNRSRHASPIISGVGLNRRSLLMIPGPTNVDSNVLQAMARPTISHVSAPFANIFAETITHLKRIFQTDSLILPLAGSATLGAEVALANVIEAGDRVLAITGGYFGSELAEVATTLGAQVDRFEVPWGSTANPNDVRERLSSAHYKALLAVHVDTSTGAANPAKELGEVARAENVLFILDTVCSMGGIDVQVDNWGIDVCFTGSQKALAVPPGLAVISFSSKALAARDHRKTPIGTYYGDIKRWMPVLLDPTKYFATPAVNMMYGLHESCKMILSEGLEARFSRHAEMASAYRTGLRAVGLRLLCDESASANTLTVAYYPDGVRDPEFRKTMVEKHGVVIAGGLGPLREKVFRVGHMGNINRVDILATIAAIESSLSDQHYEFKAGAGIEAAKQALDA